MTQIIRAGGVLGLYSFGHGFQPARPAQVKHTETSVLEVAARLESKGRVDEAQFLLERWMHHFETQTVQGSPAVRRSLKG